MNSTKKINYYFRRYPLVRVCIALFIISLIIGSSILIGFKTEKIPEIEYINPPVGEPGDVVVISGKNFGETRDMGYVEFSGVKLTSSAYISWEDSKIKLILPANIQDGLVVVGTKKYRSKPSLFSNKVDIPIPVPVVAQSSKPVITSIGNGKHSPGDLLIIQGNNFGEMRGNSKVLFTIDYDNKIADSNSVITSNMYVENLVKANEFENAYEFWSNSEIHVRIPDGVCSGVILIDTGTEKSEVFKYEITTPAKKTYKNKKIYLINYTADIADINTNDVSTITLRCPIPMETSYQPNLQITEVNPSPVLMNFQNNLIHQISKNKNYLPKTIFSQTFVIPVYEIGTEINPNRITNYKKGDFQFVDEALKSDTLIPSENEKILELCEEIVGKEKNPYRKAQLIYNYMCDNYKILSKIRKNDAEPLDLLRSKRGDAYDFAVIYTALLRAASVPALTDAGILVSQDQTTQSHWWNEFYISGSGWIPVDVSLGAGLEYKKWTENELLEERKFYFGNMDSHHIVFSRGWNELKPFSQENKIVQQPRSFALQGIWEESSPNITKYSSFWSVPIIKGIY